MPFLGLAASATFVEIVTNAFGALFGVIDGVITLFSDFDGGIQKLQQAALTFTSAFFRGLSSILGVLRRMIPAVTFVADKIAGLFGLDNPVGNFVDDLVGSAQAQLSDIATDIGQLRAQRGTIVPERVAPVGTSNVDNSQLSFQGGATTFNINGAQNPPASAGRHQP